MASNYWTVRFSDGREVSVCSSSRDRAISWAVMAYQDEGANVSSLDVLEARQEPWSDEHQI